jgi:hypothetical protein
MSAVIVIERGENCNPDTGEMFWRVRSLEEPLGEHNYWGLRADGCETLSDALACAAYLGLVAAGGDQ